MSRQPKLSLRNNIEDLKMLGKYKPFLEGLRDNSVGSHKHHGLTLSSQCKKKHQDKMKTQVDTIMSKRYHTKGDEQLANLLKTKVQDKSKPNNNYFLTADVSNVLKAIGNNTNQSTLRKPNMMTEQDLDKLFSKDSKQRTRKPSNKENIKLSFIKRVDSKQNKNITNTNEFNDTRKIAGKKDFAESIRFLDISEQDRFLEAFTNEPGLVKHEELPDIDKTVKFKSEYLVGKQIGEGAYASVRIAIYKPTNQKVAIKIYQKKKISEIARKKSVRREIKILQKIDHKNILKIFDVIETNNHVNIITEYISGICLHSFLKTQTNERVPEKQARFIFTALVESIGYLHALSICHRDIKLENVLLDTKLNPKLIDFGFATCIDSSKKVKIFCGTPSYMSPEIVQKLEYKGAPADMWALGVLLYVIMTGVFPFKAQTDKELYRKISQADYLRPDSISRSAENLISKLLTIDADKRITASEVLQHEWITGIKRNVKSSLQKKLVPEDYFNNRKLETMAAQSYSTKNQKLAQTYNKDNNLHMELRLANAELSPNKLQPKSCTNRDMIGQKQYFEKTRERLQELLKDEPESKKSQQRLTNKRYI